MDAVYQKYFFCSFNFLYWIHMHLCGTQRLRNLTNDDILQFIIYLLYISYINCIKYQPFKIHTEISKSNSSYLYVIRQNSCFHKYTEITIYIEFVFAVELEILFISALKTVHIKRSYSYVSLTFAPMLWFNLYVYLSLLHTHSKNLNRVLMGFSVLLPENGVYHFVALISTLFILNRAEFFNIFETPICNWWIGSTLYMFYTSRAEVTATNGKLCKTGIKGCIEFSYSMYWASSLALPASYGLHYLISLKIFTFLS